MFHDVLNGVNFGLSILISFSKNLIKLYVVCLGGSIVSSACKHPSFGHAPILVDAFIWPSLSAYLTTGNGGFAVRHHDTAKGTIRTATALPCVDARQRAHDSVISGNVFVAVRHARNRRQSLCRGRISLPCVLGPLPCDNNLKNRRGRPRRAWVSL
jgi:hypothetical protein